MKRKFLGILFSLIAVTCITAFAACNGNIETHKVTFYDGNTVMKEVTVEYGKTVESYIPEKEGNYQFIDWFSTPSFGHKFDFTKPVTEDVSVFAGFTLFTDDTRTFYVVGSGTSTLLMGQDWGKNINDTHKLTKTEGKNEYTITLDLLEGDEFQFAISSSWENKRGYGYLTTDKAQDGTVCFSGQGGGLGEVTAKGRNIKVEKSGNYTFTLKTYPNEDTYNTSDATYTEANKEVYNVGTFDTIDFVRNGDPLVEKVVVTNYYIKGSKITNWADMYNASTTMADNGDEYVLSVYMESGDEFMFASYNSSADGITTGSTYIKSNALTESSKAVVEGYTEAGANMKTNKAGTYTFTYNKETKALNVTLDETATMPVYDYYLDGKTDAGLNWKEADLVNNKFAETKEGSGVFALNNVVLKAGDEIVLRSFEKGEETPSYSNKLADYNATYLLPKQTATENFSQVSASNANIKVLVDGTYNITFNAYTKIITIAEAAQKATAYVKGSAIEEWGNKPVSGQMAEKDGKFELTLTMSQNDQIMIQYFAPGDDSTYGKAVTAKEVLEGDVNANFDLSGNNIKCSVAGTYVLTYDPETNSVTISLPKATAYVKGSAIENWGNKPVSGQMTENNGKFELTLTMAVGDEIMIQYFAVNDTREWGTAYVASNVQAIGASANFNLSGNNIKCTVAGTYLITLDVVSGTIVITEVNA